MILPVVWPLSGRRNSGKLKDKKENAIRPEVDVNSLFKGRLSDSAEGLVIFELNCQTNTPLPSVLP